MSELKRNRILLAKTTGPCHPDRFVDLVWAGYKVPYFVFWGRGR